MCWLEKPNMKHPSALGVFKEIKSAAKIKHVVIFLIMKHPSALEPENNTAAARKVLKKHNDDSSEVACIMLATMSSELASLEDLGAYEMLEKLKGMFQKQAHQERFDTMKQLISCKMEQGSPVSAHVVKMKGYIDQLKELDYPLSDKMAADFILNSLPSSYDQFVMNFNMND
ncbi:uncharacterized protein LOC143608718 [Bidens hawaiensis]|uniref:uncharacterized protein LOC143608718 n=1 Tax=Bidens hawaiensis TaxID=980011 RepID=UPI00404A378D